MKFSSAVQSINTRNLRVSYGMRNIILIIILRVSLAFSRFRPIATKAHMVKLSIFLPLFSLSCRIWQYGRTRYNCNKNLSYSPF
jgi:hypothetical protein